MYSLTDLGKTIADIQEHNKSGVLMVSGQSAAAATATQTYSLRFESGDLARISGPGNVLGQEAMMALLALTQWTAPRWFPLNASAGWSGQAQIKRKDLAGLLGLATAPADMSVKEAIKAGPAAGIQAKEKEAADKAGAELIKRVHAVFTSVYLGDTNADLAQLAKLHPPATEPEAFIEACIHLLEPMLGEEAARAMLSA
jgi:hypothetical protein